MWLKLNRFSPLSWPDNMLTKEWFLHFNLALIKWNRKNECRHLVMHDISSLDSPTLRQCTSVFFYIQLIFNCSVINSVIKKFSIWSFFACVYYKINFVAFYVLSELVIEASLRFYNWRIFKILIVFVSTDTLLWGVFIKL